MAAKKTTTTEEAPAEAPAFVMPEIKEDGQYTVVFTKVVERGRFKYLPRDTPVMKGSVLKEIIAREGEGVVRSAIES